MSITQTPGAKRKQKLQRRIDKQQRQLERRLDHRLPQDVSVPMFKASRIKYELADKTEAMIYGGIGLIHKMVKKIGLAESINKHLHLLKLNP